MILSFLKQGKMRMLSVAKSAHKLFHVSAIPQKSVTGEGKAIFLEVPPRNSY